MKNLRLILSAAILISSAVASGAEPAKDLSGSWLGTLDVGPTKLRVVFNITQAGDGTLAATMDSPDQGARGIPVDRVTLSGASLRMEIKAVNGGYVGEVNAAGDTIAGKWTQGANTLPLTLAKGQGGNASSTEEALAPADLAASKEAAQKLAGTWNGTLTMGGGSLRLRVNISKTAAGAATGTMDSLDQNANGIPLSVITLKDGKLRFEVRGVGGLYEGTLSADGTVLNGQWQQQGHAAPLELKKAKSE